VKRVIRILGVLWGDLIKNALQVRPPLYTPALLVQQVRSCLEDREGRNTREVWVTRLVCAANSESVRDDTRSFRVTHSCSALPINVLIRATSLGKEGKCIYR
jgi:hypothetical protein